MNEESLFTVYYYAFVFIFLSLNYFYCLRKQFSDQTVFLVGLLLRCTFLFVPVVLTSDLYRYLWEGHLLRNGISPYAYAPNDPILETVHTWYWNQIEHRHLSGIYPPVSQLCLALFAHSIVSWKLFLLVVDCFSFYALKKIKRCYVAQGKYFSIATYWLLPVSIIEVAWSGHLESLFVLMLLLAWVGILSVQRGQLKMSRLVALSCAAGTLIKYNFLFISPVAFFALAQISWERALWFTFYFIALSILGLSIFLTPDLNLFSSLGTYLTHWRYNDSLVHLLGSIFSVDWQDARSIAAVKYTLLVFWILLLGTVVYKKYRFDVAALIIFSSYLAISPVVHPWYLLWFAPFLTSVKSKGLIAFCLLAPLTYYAHLNNMTSVPVCLKAAVYAPVYALIVYDIYSAQEKSIQ